MSNVLNDDKRNQVVVLGPMGWSLRQIQKAIGVRRETAAGYLKIAGIAVFGPGRRGNKSLPDSKVAIQVTTDSKAESDPAIEPADSSESKPAIEVTDHRLWPRAGSHPNRIERLRTVSRTDRTRSLAWPQCHVDLAATG